MKIVFISARSYPSIGGVERHIEEISERLQAKGHEVLCVSENEQLSFGKPGFFKKFRIWKEMLRRIPLFLSADVIHIHDVFFWYLPVRLLLFFKPVFTTFHGYEGVVPPTKKAVALRKLSEKLSKKTIEVGAYIQHWYGTHPTHVIYGGATYLISKPTEKTSPKKKTSYVLMGRLTKDIGLPLFVKFFTHLKKAHIPFTLAVYGEGPYKKKLAAFGKTHGQVEEVSQALLSADVVCASSYLTIIDALSLGKPVLAFYDNPLKKEYLEGFPLAQKMVITNDEKKAPQLLDILRSQWDAQGTIIATQSQCSWDAITKMYLELWTK